jgi:agmatinase
MNAFDPNAAAAPGGVFGLPNTRADAGIILIPVPFDATTSYRPGTAAGPEAIRAASLQVDLYDHRFGRVYEQGIWMDAYPAQIERLSMDARDLAGPLLEKGGAGAEDAALVARIDEMCARVHKYVRTAAADVLALGKTPGLVGGEHSLSLGAIDACAAHHGPIGVLQIDAHMDLREAFEGLRFSHASIMHNVLTRVPGVERIVQVGIRDYCAAERDFAAGQGERVRVHDWADIEDAVSRGEPLSGVWSRVIDALPQKVYVSVDIDGLEPSLCPHTGTPVPGGPSFEQVGLLLAMLASSGRRVVGFDVVEVAPGPGGEPEWDANVGARMVYRLCGAVGGGDAHA